MSVHPHSYWLQTALRPKMPKIDASENVDVAIVGGGIVGLCAAYLLAEKGRRPILFERNRIVGSVTGHTTAKVTAQHGLRYKRLIDFHGKEKAKAYADANIRALDWLFEAAADLNLHCALERDVACVFSQDNETKQDFADERDAYAQLELPTCEEPVCEYVGKFAQAISMPGQGRFHPVQFLTGLANAALSRGAHIYEHSPVIEIEDRDGGVRLVVGNHTIYAQQAIIATHYPIFDSAFFIAKLAPYRSYAMAIRPQRQPEHGMFISHGDELRSWRPHRDILIVGAGCHKVGQEPDTDTEYAKLREFAKQQFGAHQVLAEWSAQDNATHDELPYVGKSPGKDHIFVATGFDGWGMTNGIAAAKLIVDLINGEESALSEALDPSRMSIHGLGKLASENLDAVGHLASDRFRKTREGSPKDLKPGEAGVFAAEGLHRIAAYRDEEGELHECSAICPHFGCQVGWNPAEKSWDCPCHGSRFDAKGRVIQAPAMTDLDPIEAKVEKDRRKLM